jgi:hypothetical protein
MTRGVRDYISSLIALTESDLDISSTISPPPSLSHGTSEQDETFAPSSESRGHIYEFLTEKMGRLVVSLKASFAMISEQICSTYPDSHVSGDHMGLFKWLVKASCTSFKPSVFPSYCDLSRFHEYIGGVINTTREPNVTTTSSPAFPTVAAPLTPLGCAFPTPKGICQLLDDLEDKIPSLGPLTLDSLDDAIDTALLNGSTDMKSGLMEGGSYTSSTLHTKCGTYYSSPVTRPKRSY